jgi:ribosomal-protein-alanine N-acetyltransferase
MYSFHPLQKADALEIMRWRYDPPYDVYNLFPEAERSGVRYLLDPKNGFFSIRAGNGELIGFCSFGKDAQVPGGDYQAQALDIGLGMRPDRTGRGAGREYIGAVLEFAAGKFAPERFRVTIAAFNERAVKAWKQSRFAEAGEFFRKNDGEKFIILVKKS